MSPGAGSLQGDFSETLKTPSAPATLVLLGYYYQLQ